MTVQPEAAGAPRATVRATATLVLIVIVLVAALSVTQIKGSPSVDSPINATVLTPDVEPSPPIGDNQAGALETGATNEPDRASYPHDTPLMGATGDRTSDANAITATHFYAYDAASRTELTSRDPDQEVPIASTVKIATALVVVQHADLDEEVAIEESDLVDYMVQSNMALAAGDVLTVEQLLHGMLIESGSDGANALARHVGTSLGGEDDPVGAFVDAMNAYAQELGLEHTHFADPTGDNDRDAYSSAHDIALLGAELMKNETLAGIVGMGSYSFTSAGNGALYEGTTTNQLLGQDGVIGLKTGSTEGAGGCVILARETANGLQIIAVLGSDLAYEENLIVRDARWDDARRIFALLD